MGAQNNLKVTPTASEDGDGAAASSDAAAVAAEAAEAGNYPAPAPRESSARVPIGVDPLAPELSGPEAQAEGDGDGLGKARRGSGGQGLFWRKKKGMRKGSAGKTKSEVHDQADLEAGTSPEDAASYMEERKKSIGDYLLEASFLMSPSRRGSLRRSQMVRGVSSVPGADETSLGSSASTARIKGKKTFSPLMLVKGKKPGQFDGDFVAPNVKHREVYIPLHLAELRDELIAGHPYWFKDPEVKRNFKRLCTCMEMRNKLHLARKYGDWLESYSAFDPDSELPRAEAPSYDERRVFKNELMEILEKAGFRGVGPRIMDRALKGKSADGYNIVPPEPSTFSVHLFYRGVRTETVVRGDEKWYTKPWEDEVRIYKRLVVMHRRQVEPRKKWLPEVMKSDEEWLDWKRTSKWHLKMFKDFPERDLDMLLPDTRVKFTWFDYAVILVPILVSAGSSIWKILNGGIKFDDPSEAASSLLLVFFPLTLAARAYSGIAKKQEDYRGLLAEELMEDMVASNSAVLSNLLYEAEEQENLESMLAYMFIWRGEAVPKTISSYEVDQDVEEFLVALLGKLGYSHRNFQIHDAIKKLHRMGIADGNIAPSKHDESHVKATSLSTALEKLNKGTQLIGPAEDTFDAERPPPRLSPLIKQRSRKKPSHDLGALGPSVPIPPGSPKRPGAAQDGPP